MNKKRLINEFLKLISFDSPSYYEDDIAFYLYDKLKELGLQVDMDKAISKLTKRDTRTGNIYGFLKGNIDGEAILFSAHMDTVNPAKGKKAIIDGDIMKSDGNAVLGSDDVTGIVEILEMLTEIKEKNLKHPDIEVIFFVAEEAFCKGSSVFDFSKVKAKKAYVFDLSGEVGTIAIAAPSILSFEIKIKGKASHAGFSLELGISSIIIAANAISKLKQGRVDSDTTINVGTINGGSGKNIIPEETIIRGEIRSMDHKKALYYLNLILDLFRSESKKMNGSIDASYEENIEAYRIDANDPVVLDYKKAINQLGFEEPKLIETFGGSDNNNLNKNGIHGVVVANAMNNIHTTKEYFSISEFEKAAKICLLLATKGE